MGDTEIHDVLRTDAADWGWARGDHRANNHRTEQCLAAAAQNSWARHTERNGKVLFTASAQAPQERLARGSRLFSSLHRIRAHHCYYHYYPFG